jgi:uncharacterized protein
MNKFLFYSILYINLINGMEPLFIQCPPLITATYGEDEESVISLIKNGANLNERDIHGQTACMYATHKNLQRILNLVSSHDIIDMQDSNGSSALMYAAGTTSDAFSLIPDILNYHPNVNLQDRWGETALMIVVNKNISIAKCLLAQKANPNIQNNCEETALMIAVQGNNYDGVLLLLEHGADKNLINEDGKTALVLAREQRHPNSAIINLLYNFKS